MKTFSSILILCLAFTFGNAQDVTVHTDSDPAADFNNYKTFTIIDRDEANAQMNQDQNRSEGEVRGSGYGTQGATGTTQQGTSDRNQGTYGTTGDQNNQNTTTQGTYGTTGDQNNQNRTNQGTYGTTGDQNNQNRTTQGTYGTTGDQNRTDESMADTDESNVEGDDVAGNPEPYEFSDREDRDEGVVTGPENMSTDSNRDESGSVGTTNRNQTETDRNNDRTYNNNQNQTDSQSGTVGTTSDNQNNMGNNDRSQNQYGTTNNQNQSNSQSGTVGTTSDNQNNMGNNDRSQNQEYGTTNNQSTYGRSGKQNKFHADPNKKALKEAIKSEMESRGFTYTENNADLLVNYSVFDGEATVSTTGDQGRPGYTAWGPQIGENESQVELEDGSVVIHFVDAEKNQLVFTAFATGTAEEGSLKEDKVQEAVSKIFEEIPGSDR